MYRILLVDDEEVVREGIAKTIDWPRHGFELIGACDNGRDAADAVTALRPDLVITDICMPFGDGLDLTEFVAREHPSTKVILLTGYDEFSYAQRAVRLNAYDYVLKPITADELRKLLDRARCDLDQDRRRADELRRIRAEHDASKHLHRERFVTRLLAGDLSPPDVAACSEEILGVSFEGSVALLTIDRDDVAPYQLRGVLASADCPTDFKRLALASLCRDSLLAFHEHACSGGGAPERVPAGTLTCVQDPEGRIAVVAAALASDAAAQLLGAAAVRLRADANERLHCTVGIGIGEPVTPVAQLARSYDSALRAFDRRFLAGRNAVVKACDLRFGDGCGAESSDAGEREIMERLIRAIKTGTLLEMMGAVDEVIRRFRSTFVSSRATLLSVQRLLVLIAEACEEIGIDKDELRECAGVDPFPDAFSFATLEEIAAGLRNLCGAIADAAHRGRDAYTRGRALHACEYIKGHFADADISLNIVCRELGMSASHFSSSFKEWTGKTFIEYLTTERIDRAKALLRTTSKKNYEIAQDVGYSDQHYFSIIFKKETGITPSEYRARFAHELK